jgi:hypothetical protein
MALFTLILLRNLLIGNQGEEKVHKVSLLFKDLLPQLADKTVF